jgi:hypothetical protein
MPATTADAKRLASSSNALRFDLPSRSMTLRIANRLFGGRRRRLRRAEEW